MGAKLRKYPEKNKIRVNICKKSVKDLVVYQIVPIFVAE
jgi:hypothetical protein